ncbi:MAG TPA: hypothetical protein VEB41_15810 [Burkholderiales bacterium]|nr:hypothetical protein [Burkholderiales bacterium]
MKPILLAVAVAFATASWAQDKPAPKAPAKPAPQAAVEENKPAAEKPAPVARNPKRAEDARHCLEKASNTEIIKCAEAYL